VTLVEFADFECPYSARFEEPLQRALKKYGDDFINGRRYEGAKGFEELTPILDEELRKARALVAPGVPPRERLRRAHQGAHGPPPPPPKIPYVPEPQAIAVRIGGVATG
jgi:hypothetical protein